MKLVNAERARLAEQIERADCQAAKWKRAAVMLSEQREEHQAESDEQQAVLAATEAQAERVRFEVTTPLVAQAAEDGTAYLAARQRMWDVSGDRRSVRAFQRRSAARVQARAIKELGELEATMSRRWSSMPNTTMALPTWAASTAGHVAENDPRVIETRQRAASEQERLHALHARQRRECDALRRSIYGRARTAGGAATRAEGWARQAEEARRLLGQIEALPIDQAAVLIRERIEVQKAAERALAERAALVRARP